MWNLEESLHRHGRRTATNISRSKAEISMQVKWRKNERNNLFRQRLWHLTCKCYGFIQYVTKVGVITLEYFYCLRAALYGRGSWQYSCLEYIYNPHIINVFTFNILNTFKQTLYLFGNLLRTSHPHQHVRIIERNRTVELLDKYFTSREVQWSRIRGLIWSSIPLCTLNGARLAHIWMCFACKWRMLFGLTIKWVLFCCYSKKYRTPMCTMWVDKRVNRMYGTAFIVGRKKVFGNVKCFKCNFKWF